MHTHTNIQNKTYHQTTTTTKTKQTNKQKTQSNNKTPKAKAKTSRPNGKLCTPSIEEAEMDLQIQGQPGLHSKTISKADKPNKAQKKEMLAFYRRTDRMHFNLQTNTFSKIIIHSC